MDYKFITDTKIRDKLLKAQKQRLEIISDIDFDRQYQIKVKKQDDSQNKLKSYITKEQKIRHKAKVSSVLKDVKAKRKKADRENNIYEINDNNSLKNIYGKKRIKLKAPSTNELGIVTKQLASMIRTGLPLLEALNIISDSNENPTLKFVFNESALGISRGSTFLECLERYPIVFDDMYLALISAGESAGLLPNVLLRQAKLLEDLSKTKGEIKSALSYPIAIFIITIIVVLVMLIFVIPIFQDIYSNAGVQLPILTQLLINSSLYIKDVSFLYKGLPIVIGLIYLMIIITKTESFLMLRDRLLLKLPLTKDLITKTALANFSRTLSSLSSAGVPILESILIAKKTVSNRLFRRVFDKMFSGIQSGQQIYKTLEQERIVPRMFTSMFRIGEETGELTEMINKIADFYEEDVSSTVKTLTSILEPLLIVFVALIVAIILVAMYLPMFDMMSVTS